MWGATCKGGDDQRILTNISIHAPRVGSDAGNCGSWSVSWKFQSTLPVWGATGCAQYLRRDQSISIHAPRVGSDASGAARKTVPEDFNPRSPCGERPRHWRDHRTDGKDFNPRSPCGERHFRFSEFYIFFTFQSTLPVWGATTIISLIFLMIAISIHAPRVGSDRDRSRQRRPEDISIHAPRVGSDLQVASCESAKSLISIHAPRVGSDRSSDQANNRDNEFQSTLPVWGATMVAPVLDRGVKISIHAPRVGSDHGCGSYVQHRKHFNPRSPCGERPRNVKQP